MITREVEGIDRHDPWIMVMLRQFCRFLACLFWVAVCDMGRFDLRPRGPWRFKPGPEVRQDNYDGDER